MLKGKATLEKYLKETENFLVHVCARHCQLLSTWAPTMRTFLKIPSTLDCVRSVLLARCCVFLKFHIFFASEHGACLTCLSLILALEGTSDFYFTNSKTCPFQMSNHFQMHWLTSWLTSSYSLSSILDTCTLLLFADTVLCWHVGPGIWWFAAWIHDGLQTGLWGESSYPGIQLLYILYCMDFS